MGAVPASPDFAALVPMQASVIFLRMTEFAALPVADQARQRQRLTKLVGSMLPMWREDARLVLEADDGTAIVALDDPELALQAAHRAATHPNLIVGLHHGPLQVVDVDGTTQLRGNGVETALAIAALPDASPIAATREFQRALFLASPRAAEALRPAGHFVDHRLRSHELYIPDAAAARARQQRRMLLGGAVVTGILGMGLLARAARQGSQAARRPAMVELDIRPVGEVWVNGEFKGASPPLTRLSLPSGAHKIEILNPRAKPMVMNLQLKPGEELQLRHVFAAPAPAQRSEEGSEPKPVRKVREWVDQMKKQW